MTPSKQVTLFALDCGATNWRLFRVGYSLNGNLVHILGEPQPSPLTSFSERKLPAIFTLNPAGTAIENFGEVSMGQLEDENTRERVRDYFKPCIGSHLEKTPLPHQKRYTHAQAINFTRILLEVVVEQIRSEKWRVSAFDEQVHFSFAYPVHWQYDHEGSILKEFKTLVLKCFPEDIHKQIYFVPEPEGAILSLKRQGLLDSPSDGKTTLIVDVGGSTTDIVAGQINPSTGELLYLGHYGEPFGGGLYDAEMAKYLVGALNIPASVLADDPSALVSLRIFGQRLKESLSRQLLQSMSGGTDRVAQRMITLVTRDNKIYRQLIKLDEATFQRITSSLNQTFENLINQAMQTIALDEGEIGQVALVGGGVQLFSIIRHLRERFGEKKIVLADSPDEIVVQGVGLEFGSSLGTLAPGASLVIVPPVIKSEKESAPVSEVGWKLVSLDGKIHSLNKDIIKIGRARESHIWLESEKASRRHAEIKLEGNNLTVLCLGSTNGTFVNGERTKAKQPRLLKMGDKIRFGDREFVVELV